MTITVHTWRPEEWKTEVPDWTIEKCTSADKEGVYDLLKRAFFKYEPLTCDLTDHPPMDDLFAVKMIAQGHSYKAVLPTGKIVGVVINVHFPDIPDDEEPPTTGRISQIFQLFDFLERETGHLTKGLLEVHILTTDPDFTRQGMAKALIRASEDLARNNNLRGLKMACSSAYSAQLARGLNYKEVYSLAYCDYKDEKGNIVFFPPEIHSHMRLFIKEFNN